VQAYSQEFARIYNAKWSGFAEQVAPKILEFYSSTPTGRKNKSVLDLCCGAGHLAQHFLKHDYRVVGLDLSEHMLGFAHENLARYVESGQCELVRADASEFTLEERFGLVVSTYDSLNHLEDESALQNCIRCVSAICDGYFIFDLNTRSGLKNWNNVQVDEGDENELVIARGEYDGQGDKAVMRITCFVRMHDGSYKRFDESVYNTAFSLSNVNGILLDTGWKNVYFARIKDLRSPVAEPESENRIFVIASK